MLQSLFTTWKHLSIVPKNGSCSKFAPQLDQAMLKENAIKKSTAEGLENDWIRVLKAQSSLDLNPNQMLEILELMMENVQNSGLKQAFKRLIRW